MSWFGAEAAMLAVIFGRASCSEAAVLTTLGWNKIFLQYNMGTDLDFTLDYKVKSRCSIRASADPGQLVNEPSGAAPRP
jgi:hypothetical protein